MGEGWWGYVLYIVLCQKIKQQQPRCTAQTPMAAVTTRGSSACNVFQSPADARPVWTTQRSTNKFAAYGCDQREWWSCAWLPSSATGDHPRGRRKSVLLVCVCVRACLLCLHACMYLCAGTCVWGGNHVYLIPPWDNIFLVQPYCEFMIFYEFVSRFYFDVSIHGLILT